jgi:methionine synthase I (cobalamin-dependent)
MGTELIARGIGLGKCHDYVNIESPQTVLDVHMSYLNAGSSAVLTNTFGANACALARHGLADRVVQINTAGAEIARQAAGDQKYVLGDIGPCGDFLEPIGLLKPGELKQAFTDQAQALIAAGVDGLIIETMTALDELKIAIQAAKSVSGSLPVFASMAFDHANGRFTTIMGAGVESSIAAMSDAGADAVGFNCGTASLDEYITLARRFVSIITASAIDVPIFAEPNAGRPQLIDDKAVYKVSPDAFAKGVAGICSAGISIIGGCCGTTPSHISVLAKQLTPPARYPPLSS